MSDVSAFYAGGVVHHPGGDKSSVAVRSFGSGPPLVMLHGFPLHGATYRRMLPELARHRTCYVFDLLGAGSSRWSPEDDFSFTAQARSVSQALGALGVGDYDLLAHDSGATVARLLALLDRDRVRRLVLINTEVPGHRPPWIPLYGKLLALPGSASVFQWLLRSRAFLHSSAGFGGCFFDSELIDGEFHAQFIEPLVRSRQLVRGQARYLSGLNWREVDALAARHESIRSPVLVVWGADDPTFPAAEGRRLAAQLPSCVGYRPIAGARLLPHEEKPKELIRHVLGFIQAMNG